MSLFWRCLLNNLESSIDERVGQVRTDTFDITFGEIINLHENSEITIQPEYQRLFRWSDEQKSRLIESILLELPIPQIFVIENSDGVLELIDGLQRVSSVIQFVNPTALGSVQENEESKMEPLRLCGCDLVEELNGLTYEELPLILKLRIKRSSVRTIVIKRQSRFFIRYAMFKRLNTGGSDLSYQEIRNCSARMTGDKGIEFYSFLQRLASVNSFCNCIEPLSQSDKDQKGDEELVLRFFAAKNAQNLFKGSVRDWLNDYMESILLEKMEFEFAKEESDFQSLFAYLDRLLGSGAFVKYRDNRPIGALAPAYFEGVTIGVFNILNSIQNLPDELVREKIVSTLQNAEFKSNTGPGANKLEKLKGRINTIQNGLMELLNE